MTIISSVWVLICGSYGTQLDAAVPKRTVVLMRRVVKAVVAAMVVALSVPTPATAYPALAHEAEGEGDVPASERGLRFSAGGRRAGRYPEIAGRRATDSFGVPPRSTPFKWNGR